MKSRRFFPRLMLTTVVLAAASAPAWRAAARDADRDSFWRVTGLIVTDGSPFKALVAPGLHFRHIYHRDDDPLFDNLYLDGGGEALLIPTSPALRLGVEWMPLAAVVLKGSFTTFLYTGAALGLGHGLSFDGPDAPFDDATFSARRGEEQATLAHRPALSLRLRGNAGPVVLDSETELGAWYVQGPAGEYWYEPGYDLLIARGELDAVISNRSALLFQLFAGAPGSGTMLLAGVGNEYARAYRSGLSRDRLGAVVIWVPFPRLWGASRPTVVASAGVTLSHKHRRHDPWGQLVLSFGWDLHDSEDR